MSYLDRTVKAWMVASVSAIVLLGALYLATVAGAAVPTVVTGGATEIARSSMKVCGSVEPNGEATTYHFTYGSYKEGWEENTTTTESAGDGVAAVEECAQLTGLSVNTYYRYNIVAENESGEVAGYEAYATSGPAVEGLKTETASGVKRQGPTSEVTLNGTLEPNGYDTHYYFEYGTPDLPERPPEIFPVLPGADAGDANGVQHFAVTIKIPTNVRYVYRLDGVNQFGTTNGQEMSVLAPAVEGVTTLTPFGVTANRAGLRGTLEPNGYDTHWQFKCRSEDYFASRPVFYVPTVPVDAGTVSGPVAVEATLSELGVGNPLGGNTPIQCDLVASNSLGVDEGTPLDFSTEKAAPTFEGVATPTVTETTAAVKASLLTQNEVTKYWVEYVDSEGYAPSATNPYEAGVVSTGPPTEATPYVTTDILRGVTGLAPQTTYHYRFVAENGTGTTYSADHTFTTAAPTPPRVNTGSFGDLSSTSVTLSGVVNPEGLKTSYEFQLGETAEYGGAEIFGNAGEAGGEEQVSTTLDYLVPGTTYHYRLVATNVDGTTYGADQTFTTPSVPSPIGQLATSPLIAFTPVAFPKENGATTVKAVKRAKKKVKAKKKAKKKRGKPKTKKK